jgi:predicted lipid carrier protein YhbT
MQRPPYALPAAIGKALSLLPAYPGSLLFALAADLVLRKSIPDDTLRMLERKRLAIRVTDAGVAFGLRFERGRFAALRPAETPDVTISASLHDFLLLAARKEDPDTLFFSRRLLIEGDTELGLLVKNALDALDLPALLRNVIAGRPGAHTRGS